MRLKRSSLAVAWDNYASERRNVTWSNMALGCTSQKKSKAHLTWKELNELEGKILRWMFCGFCRAAAVLGSRRRQSSGGGPRWISWRKGRHLSSLWRDNDRDATGVTRATIVLVRLVAFLVLGKT